MKKIKLYMIFLSCFMLNSICYADVPTSPVLTPKVQSTVPVKAQTATTVKPHVATTPAVAESASFENCVRVYGTSADNLFYLTLAAISASNYSLDEIQSRTGLISFEASNKELLASITAVSNNESMIRITPLNNSYSFSPALIERIFTYLANNIK